MDNELKIPKEPEELIRPEKPLFAAQRPWLIGVLTALSAGLYLTFYLYIQARDLKRLQEKRRPWAWFLAPFLAITLPFCMDRLTTSFQAIGKTAGVQIPNRGGSLGFMVFLGLVIITLSDRFFEQYFGLIWLAVLPLIGIPMALLTRDINSVKQSLEPEWFRRDHFKLSPGTWVWSGFCFLIFLPIVGFLTYTEIMHLSRTQLVEGQPWIDGEQRFSVVSPDEWAIAPIGTYSDGSSEAEFSLSSLAFAAVFDQNMGASPADLGIIRRQEFKAEYPDGKCQEKRWLEPETLERRGRLSCEVLWLGAVVIVESTSVSNGKSHVELYSRAEVSPRNKEVIERKLNNISEGFQIVEADKRAESP